MAKKQCGKNLRELGLLADGWILYGYRYGVWQSAIVHTCLLILLALIVIENETLKPIKIHLSFNETLHEDVTLDNVHVDMPEIVEKDNTEKDFQEIPINTSDVGSDNIALELEYTEAYVSIEPSLSELTQIIASNNLSSIDNENSENFTEKTSDKLDLDTETLIRNIFSGRSDTNQNSGQRIGGGQNLNTGNGDIGDRLRKAGAKTGDIQISIGWDSIDDIDLHVLFKNKFGQSSYICWMSRTGVNNGVLDVDMNANPAMLTNKPVENIFWPHGQSPEGEFSVGIHNFRNWSGNPAVPVTIIVKNKDVIKTIKATAIYGQTTKEVFRFTSP